MHKIVLTEIPIYYGDVSMPKNFEIQRGSLILDGVKAELSNSKFKFSREWDMLRTYIQDHIKVKHKLSIGSKDTWVDAYKPGQTSQPIINVNPVDLLNSPDFTMLYGLKTEECSVRIYYDDNRGKGRSWDIDLTDNKFIMFPSTCMYHLQNNQTHNLNYVQTITYEFI
jgi:hypothetical protein